MVGVVLGRAGRSRLVLAVALVAAALLVVPAAVATGSSQASWDPDASFERPVARVLRDVPAGVVSLGDSYSSGLGTGSYDDDCDRNDGAWGMLIFADAVPAADRHLLACSGADISDVYDQLDELEAVGGAGGRLITLTVGGNDIGFAGELASCFVPFNGCQDREDALMGEIDALVEPLTDLYLAVQAAAPGDTLIVGGYPLLVPDPDVRDDCRALTPLLTDKERRMIRRLGRELNRVIEEAAAAAGVRSAGTDLEEVFDGHEACANRSGDWLNGLKLSWPFGAAEPEGDVEPQWEVIATFVRDSFHPNPDGQAGYAEAFTRTWSHA